MSKGAFPVNGPKAAGVIVEGIKTGAIKKAVVQGADLLEVRVDSFVDLDPVSLAVSLRKLKKISGLPIILTVRSKKEGGLQPLSDRTRAALFEALIPYSDIVDIELSSNGIIENVVSSAKSNGKTVIISHHDFKGTPGDAALRDLIKKSREKGADIVKIAAHAGSLKDMKRLAGILLGDDGLIIIAMGEKGAASRVFFPMLGSLITYGSITGKTAPGQLTLKEIKEAFKKYATA